MTPYDPKSIEEKWNKKWLEEKVFKVADDSKKLKYYQLETFPYPSAAGLHVGHPKGWTAEDIHARYMRMRGYEVLYTMGWDAFGLPTENYAIKVGRPPKEVALENTTNFRRQVQMFGFSYDWDREIDTSSPEYYKWTQWLFIQLYKKGLAYRKDAKVNWCPKDQTVLANEQVIDGKCERCGTEIEERMMEQWFLKITDYADRLLADLDGLDWPAATIKRQGDWIGRSEGAELQFAIKGSDEKITVFTTRPDTLFGATYLVLAPEHELIKQLGLKIQNGDEVLKYIEETTHKTDRMRQEEAKNKTGVALKGIRAINPATKEEIPVWIADYVLGSYGTGAIMAVPAHDERDFEFAKKFGLEIKKVVVPKAIIPGVPIVSAAMGGAAPELRAEEDLWEGLGDLVNSGEFSGMDSEKAKPEIIKFVGGTTKTQYKIRDWSVSRQRYWGVPIPMIHCGKCGIVPVPENDLPVVLPELENYRPQGMPPLAGSPSFINVKCPQCGGDAKRDAETLDTFVDSSWYFLRYPDPHNAAEIFNKEKVRHWMPVDLYVIGAEHTVMHLLYSRFITKFLYDEGLVSFVEPFKKMRHIGLIMGADGQKMSKSKGNVVNPDEIVAEFSADAMRMYLMFLGPFYEATPWDAKGILGVERFLKRFWKYSNDILEQKSFASDASGESQKPSATNALHRTIKKVGEDIEAFKFNTAISALMILLNELEMSVAITKEELGALMKIIHPFTPHIGQELWSLAGNKNYLDFEPWPVYDPTLIAREKITIVFQVNGKTKDSASVDATIDEATAKEMALASQKVNTAIIAASGASDAGSRAPKRIIYVDKKLVNIVI